MISKPDVGRERRCGIPEVVYGESKTSEDLTTVMQELAGRAGLAIATKVEESKAKAVINALGSKPLKAVYHKRARVLAASKKGFKPKKKGVVGILAAGTSDIAVAEEARVILEELGCRVLFEYDVGIAGIHRLFPAIERLKKASVLIAVAGMEGALPSVVSGLVKAPVIGVPTSVGYGYGGKGVAALQTMLNSCSPVGVVNIDNGYGAAALAYKIASRLK
jgi:NCAIR mutase (PurE)-related protein